MTATEMTKYAKDLVDGDLVDLEHDKYARMNIDRGWGGGPPDDEVWAVVDSYEYARVLGVERETPNCVRVDLEGRSIGMPPEHLLVVLLPSEQDNDDANH